MNQKEVVETLSFNAKIEPSFTELGNTLVCLCVHFLLIFALLRHYKHTLLETGTMIFHNNNKNLDPSFEH
jgi:hypothetical protein